MQIHLPFPRHNQTKFIRLDSHRCKACWRCIEACPNHVIGKTPSSHHQHAHVDQAAACKGCKKCVQACPNQAIRYTLVAPERV